MSLFALFRYEGSIFQRVNYQSRKLLIALWSSVDCKARTLLPQIGLKHPTTWPSRTISIDSQQLRQHFSSTFTTVITKLSVLCREAWGRNLIITLRMLIDHFNGRCSNASLQNPLQWMVRQEGLKKRQRGDLGTQYQTVNSIHLGHNEEKSNLEPGKPLMKEFYISITRV